jgi:hypothetical protein
MERNELTDDDDVRPCSPFFLRAMSSDALSPRHQGAAACYAEFFYGDVIVS